jgi:hypothetical protein
MKFQCVVAAASVVVGCSGSVGLPDAPPPGQGIQYKMLSTLAPGQEIERVQFFVVPPEGLYVNRTEVRFTTGSHHILLFKTPYTSIPTKDIHGNEVDTSGIIDAPRGGTADWEIDSIIAGAQSADSPSIVDGLPKGVAVKLDPGTVLLLNTHYLNATPKQVSCEARVNLWTVPKEEVTQEAGVFLFYDPIIRVPSMASSYAEMSCPAFSDITVLNVQTHMHARGLGGEIQILPAGGGTPNKIYTSDTWEQVPVKLFQPGLQVAAGSWIDYHCNYRNETDHTVLQGLTTKDEMCVIVGLYYPRDAKTELCSPDGTFANLGRAGTWMGSGGTAGCMESLGCLGQATDSDSTYQCILNACPSVAKPLNDAFRCSGASQPNCTMNCAHDSDPMTCVQTCVQTACTPQLAACGTATCKQN